MDTPAQPSQWERTTTRRFLRWLFSWRTVRRALIALAWMVTLIALLYGEENWRGRRAWNSYRQEQEARGVQLDLKAFIPHTIPDEQNFAATPFVESWFTQLTNQQRRWDDSFSRANVKVPTTDQSLRQFMDLVAWEAAMKAVETGSADSRRITESGKLDAKSRATAAPGVLEGLRGSEANLQELRSASSRPSSRYPVVYNLENPWGILLPHLANVKAACLRLQLKACAELAAGQPDQAFEDVKLTLYLADSVKDEVFLISYLVRAACLELALQPIWEGLAEHRWSEARLQELQTRFQRYDFLTGFQRPRDAERAAIVLTADLLHRQKYRLSELAMPSPPGAAQSTTGSEFADLLGRIAPRGWYHLEQVNACRLYQNESAGAFDPAQRRVSPRLLAADAREFERTIGGGRLGKELNAILRHQILAALLLPGLSQLPLKAATAQAAADQAALGCALERSRLANGQFPESLAALVPQFMAQLPKDALTGEPYKYRRTAEGQFVLYSIGWDEKDDGGVSGDTLFEEKDGDWVWQYPTR